MIRRSTLRAQIAAALRDEILAGRLPAGSHFTVKEIAEQYGVSATPVREAMVDLAAQGLLDVEQHRGFRVHEFTIDDYRAMVQARMVVLDGLFHGFVEAQRSGRAGPVTGLVAGPELAAATGESEGQGSAADAAGSPHAVSGPAPGGSRWPLAPEFALDSAVFASVRRRAEAAVRAARTGDLDVLIGYDLRYWRELCGVIGNPYICDFLDRLRIQCWVFCVPGLRGNHEVGTQLWAGYRELVDAVELRDAVESRRIVAEYHLHALALAERPAAPLSP
ncbi:MAG TPA: GntR family transcriptional regulator [Streptomyces sp.]|nr:GntR family transcriptional regulator [Streptomyces sp.]